MQEKVKNFLIFVGLLAFYLTLSLLTAPDGSQQDSSKSTNTTETGSSPVTTPPKKNDIPETDKYNQALAAFGTIHGESYVGSWRHNDTKSDKKFLDNYERNTGLLSVKFSYHISSTSSEPIAQNNFENRDEVILLSVYDGHYSDDHHYEYYIKNGKYDPETGLYTANDLKARITERQDLAIIKDYECDINIVVNISPLIKQNGTIESNNFINLTVVSEECNLGLTGFNIREDERDMDKKVTNYAFLLVLISSVSFYQVAKVLKHVIESANDAKKYSLLTIGAITIWDAYICLSHLVLAMDMDRIFHLFIMPIFMFFILFGVVDVRLLVIIWRAKNEAVLQDQNEMRRGMMQLNLKLYGGMFLSLTLFYNFITNNVFLLIAHLYLIPQIIHNATRSQRPDATLNPLFYLTLVKSFLALYFRGCPENFLRLRPSTWFTVLLIFVVAIQIIWIQLQTIYGHKFFIPEFLLPPRYNYLLEVPVRDVELGTDTEFWDDCAICMSALDTQPPVPPNSDAPRQIQDLYATLRPKATQCMRTPCGHKFHVNCLLEWMTIKMECPTCRTPLPSVE